MRLKVELELQLEQMSLRNYTLRQIYVDISALSGVFFFFFFFFLRPFENSLKIFLDFFFPVFCFVLLFQMDKYCSAQNWRLARSKIHIVYMYEHRF